MNLIDRILAALGWSPPAVPVPPRVRRLRAICPDCGGDFAVISSTGKLWAHNGQDGAPCRPPVSSDHHESDFGPLAQHDTWDEHEGLR